MDVCISKDVCYWPQIVDYKQIYEENKEALFILNKRDPGKILTSFNNWSNYTQRLFNFNPELVDSKTDEGFLRFVTRHYSNIESFFKDHPEAKFISYDIDINSIADLARYVDIGEFIELPRINGSRTPVGPTHGQDEEKVLLHHPTRTLGPGY